MSLEYFNTEDEYAKYKNLKKQDVKYLQEWIEKQPHLPPLLDVELIIFLRSCQYSVEKTKITIDNFFTLKASADLFVKIDLEHLKVVMNGSQYVLLPNLTPEGYIILYLKINMSTSDYIFVDHLCYIDCICKLYLLQKGSVNGLIVLLNMEGYTFGHLTKVPLSCIKKYIVFLQEALPIRLMSIHFINCTAVIDKIFVLIKPLIKKELHDVMHVYGNNLEDLYKFIPLECLPENLGGQGGKLSVLHEQQKNDVIDNIEFLKQDEKRIADESKRENKLKSINNMFGVEGSFKKLEID